MSLALDPRVKPEDDEGERRVSEREYDAQLIVALSELSLRCSIFP